ncbi:MAG TPA: nucleotidyltransferase family protein [Sphingomicrobium sp.]|nr:NTP transferase domain-containing protein [Sphingomonas sp.]HWJ38182.1 nucleotidyltransferase family protein [Sphingomicrobium sp.]
MKDWRKAEVSIDATLRGVMRQIDAASLQIALVVDADEHLVGTVTDGDLRRGILRGASLDDPVTKVMNREPTTVVLGEDPAAILGLMRTAKLRHVPVTDHGRLVGLETLEELISAPERNNPVVIMAGGRGTRLLPLTADRPKPMLPVAGRPILEHALVGLAEQGFRDFHIAVNYLGDMVEEHFGDGSRWNVSISYLRETQPLGTAGALSLLSAEPTEPLLVMNGDILTKLNFVQLMEAHEQGRDAATMCVRQYDHQIPFGVTLIEEDRLVALEEKPTIRNFVSAGIYVVQPDVVHRVPAGRFFDMPQLLNGLIADGRRVQVFPITEYWLDVGRHDDMHRALGDFEELAE